MLALSSNRYIMDYFICPKCEGHGYTAENLMTVLKNEFKFARRCNRCHGQGSLDWIENVVGKPEKSPIHYPLLKMRRRNETETSDTLL